VNKVERQEMHLLDRVGRRLALLSWRIRADSDIAISAVRTHDENSMATARFDESGFVFAML